MTILNILGILLIVLSKKYDANFLKYYGIFFLIMFVPGLFKILTQILISQKKSNVVSKTQTNYKKSSSNKYELNVEKMPPLSKQWLTKGGVCKKFEEHDFTFTSLNIQKNTAILNFRNRVFWENFDVEAKKILKQAIDCAIILCDYTYLYPSSYVSNPNDSDTLFLLEKMFPWEQAKSITSNIKN